jgi:hypothetical protein
MEDNEVGAVVYKRKPNVHVNEWLNPLAIN